MHVYGTDWNNLNIYFVRLSRGNFLGSKKLFGGNRTHAAGVAHSTVDCFTVVGTLDLQFGVVKSNPVDVAMCFLAVELRWPPKEVLRSVFTANK